MKYVIYAAVALAVLWAVWYLVRRIRALARGEACGDCGRCRSQDCPNRKK